MQTAYVIEASFIDKQTIHINEPIDVGSGDILVIIQRINKSVKKKRQFGCAKGTIEIKEGFNDPIEDFKDYL